MSWTVNYLPEAAIDRDKLDGSVKAQVRKGILKVAENPLPKTEGGYGDPLGNIGGTNLTGLFKIKFRDIGIRVVYGLKREGETMTVVIISMREDSKVYTEANKRREKYNI